MDNLHLLLKCFSVAVNFIGLILWISNLLKNNNYNIFSRFMSFIATVFQLTLFIYTLILLLDKTI